MSAVVYLAIQIIIRQIEFIVQVPFPCCMELLKVISLLFLDNSDGLIEHTYEVPQILVHHGVFDSKYCLMVVLYGVG